MKVSAVVLTTGARPAELAAALDSVRIQRAVDVELIVVRNAVQAEATLQRDGDVLWVSPCDNLGIPGGRNVGASHATGALLLFLDDDAVLAGPDVLAQAVGRLAADPQLAVVTMRLVDPISGRTERRHVPRLRVGDPTRSSWVTTFLGGACVIRRTAFDEAGGLPARFFYAHEETSLAWRLLDLGYRIRYAGDLVVRHPAASPARHDRYNELTARNRVLLARMHLPWPVAVLYLGVWVVATLLRERRVNRAWWRGFRSGLTADHVVRHPIRWSTIWRMTRYGRPPLV